MIKNTAGQTIGAQMINASTGAAFTGAVTVAVTVDAGTQAPGSVGSGACTHEGGGYHTYAPAQAETNGDLVAFTFSGTGAIPVTVQVYTVAGDAFSRLGAPAGASVSADVAAIKAETATILSDTNDIQTRIPAALVGGRIDANVGAISGDSVAADNLEAAADGTGFNLGGGSVVAASVTGAVGSVTGNVGGNVSGSVGSVTGNVGGNVTGSVGSVATGGITAASIAADAIGASELAGDAAAEIATAVRTELTTELGRVDVAVSSRLASASYTSPPAASTIAAAVWDYLTSAATTVGSLGKLIVDNLNATVSSRLASASYTAPLDAAGTRAAVGLASANLDTQLTAIDDAIDTEVGAIKAKTDQLTFTTANRVDARAFAVDDKTGYAIGTGGISAAAFAAGAIDAAALNADAIDEILDEQIGDSTVTMRQSLKLMAAVLGGKVSGAGTATITFRNVADTVDVVVATVDGAGNRTAITRTL